MKKIYKLFAAVLSLCLAAGALALAACGEKDGKVTYNVSLSCTDTLIFGGLIVQIKGEDGALIEEKPAPDGSVSFTLEGAEYTVDLAEKAGFEGILQEYVYSVATLSAEKSSAQIEILPVSQQYQGQETIAYSVKVVKPDGSPVAGVSVQLCGGPSYVCNFSVTDANGVAPFSLPAGSYEVHIAQKIDGYTFDNTAYTMGTEGGELTVSLVAA